MQSSEFELQHATLETIQSTERQRYLDMYRQMLRIRQFEEQVGVLYSKRQLFGPVHLYIGEEAVAVGVCAALRRDDYITSTHRGHGHCLAKGASVHRMFAEILGKATGYCQGKGGSMHVADPDTGNLGANGIVGGSTGIAAGAALSARMRGTDQVVVCFFGDGALGQGLLYESMNMASLWKLPVLFICENNLYAEYSHYLETTAGVVRARPEAFGIYTEEVDGQDARLVYAAACRGVERARHNDGPAFLCCNTYRFSGHYMGDVNRPYRSREEEEFWKNHRDPLKILASWLREQEMADEALLAGIDAEILEEVSAGIQLAVNDSYPGPIQVNHHVYA